MPRVLSSVLVLLLSSSLALAEVRICVDPGHPSETEEGTEVLNGLTEVHVAWAVARRLRSLLESRGYAVTMTKRRERELVTNRDRARIANRAKAAVMVRLHCDTSDEKGFALYHPDRQGRNAGVVGPSHAVIRESRKAAVAIHAGMARRLAGALNDCGVRGESRTFIGSKQGALTGSIHAQVPTVLIEMAVLTQKADAAFIGSPGGQKRMAEAIAAGIENYVKAR